MLSWNKGVWELRISCSFVFAAASFACCNLFVHSALRNSSVTLELKVVSQYLCTQKYLITN